MTVFYEGSIAIGPDDCLLNIDDIIAFIRLYNGGLPVVGGEEIAEFIIDHLYPIFDRKQRIATCDLHPHGQITMAHSYIGIVPFKEITQEMFDRGEILLSDVAQFTLDDVRLMLLATGGSYTAWPTHGTAGSGEHNLDPLLDLKDWSFLFPKGMDPTDDANSAFRSLRGTLTQLSSLLHGLGFKRLFLTGLAYDVCVGLTAIDGTKLGFEVYVIKDATRAIDIPARDDHPGSVALIEREFDKVGVRVINAQQLYRVR